MFSSSTKISLLTLKKQIFYLFIITAYLSIVNLEAQDDVANNSASNNQKSSPIDDLSYRVQTSLARAKPETAAKQDEQQLTPKAPVKSLLTSINPSTKATTTKSPLNGLSSSMNNLWNGVIRQVRQTTRKRPTSASTTPIASPTTTTTTMLVPISSTETTTSPVLSAEDIEELLLADKSKRKRFQSKSKKKKNEVEPSEPEVGEEEEEEDEDSLREKLLNKRRLKSSTRKPAVSSTTLSTISTSLAPATNHSHLDSQKSSSVNNGSSSSSSIDNTTQVDSSPTSLPKLTGHLEISSNSVANQTNTTKSNSTAEQQTVPVNSTNQLTSGPIFPPNCCCNKTYGQYLSANHNLTTANTDPSIVALNATNQVPLNNSTIHKPINSILANETKHFNNITRAPISLASHKLEPQSLNNKKSFNANRTVAEMLQDMDEDHSKISDNVHEQANSLRKFIVVSSICVVAATSIVIAAILYFMNR